VNSLFSIKIVQDERAQYAFSAIAGSAKGLGEPTDEFHKTITSPETKERMPQQDLMLINSKFFEKTKIEQAYIFLIILRHAILVEVISKIK
jgi:hypothetical protein